MWPLFYLAVTLVVALLIMSKKITIQIPTKDGVQVFHLGRTSVITLLTFVIAISAFIAGSWYVSEQQRYAQQVLVKAVVQLEGAKNEITALYQEQLDTNHSLSEALSNKNNQLQLLGKRVHDVESVLGLADEAFKLDEIHVERDERINTAAIDPAVRATMLRLIPNGSPIDYQRISSSFGRRINPTSGKSYFHTGIDLTCKRGDEILAPADGVVETVRPNDKDSGNYLTLRHSFGFMSSYSHLHRFKVTGGQFVTKGDVIAYCGNSGTSAEPHLHYEVQFLGRTLNPQHLMDWTPDNFNYVFEQEKKVKWGSLIKLIDNVVSLQFN